MSIRVQGNPLTKRKNRLKTVKNVDLVTISLQGKNVERVRYCLLRIT